MIQTHIKTVHIQYITYIYNIRYCMNSNDIRNKNESYSDKDISELEFLLIMF